MIVNASPLILFAQLDRLELLQKLFGTLTISPEVYKEIVKKGSAHAEAKIVQCAVAERKISVKPLKPEFQKKAEAFLAAYPALDRGEAETITRAFQEKSKEAVIDEKSAVRIARLHGLKVFGSLAILLRCYDRNLLAETEVKMIMDELFSHKFRMSGEVVNAFWRLFEKVKRKKTAFKTLSRTPRLPQAL